jgi:hypothetical protein
MEPEGSLLSSQELSTCTYPGNIINTIFIFIMQECNVRVIMKAKTKDSCQEMFSKLRILTL